MDLQLWIENDTVLYEFYKKPMARPTVMNANIAMPEKVKREMTSNELLSRLMNNIHGLPDSEGGSSGEDKDQISKGKK